MQFTISAAAFMAFVSTALAQVDGFDVIRAPTRDELVPAGETYTITWDAAPAEYDDEAVNIILLAGPNPTSLFPAAEPVATGLVNSAGTYGWDVPADLGDDAVYGLKIELDSDKTIFQYSFPFHIEASEDGGKGNSTASSTDAAPSSTKGSSSTAAPKPTASANSTNTVAPPKTTFTSTVSEDATPSPSSTGDVDPVPSNGATRSAAGAVALLGGLAVAAFGL